VIFAPVATGLGAAVCVMERSAACTVALAVAVLLAEFGSKVVEVTVAVPPAAPPPPMIVPFVAAVLTVTTIAMVEVPPFAKLAAVVHVSVPVAPTATPVHV